MAEALDSSYLEGEVAPPRELVVVAFVFLKGLSPVVAPSIYKLAPSVCALSRGDTYLAD